jgi:hypothetical protein
MGFFSGETKIDVFANTCHLTDVDTTSVADAVLYAILSGESIASSILNVTMNQMSNQMKQFRAYAKESYSLGLPKVTYESSVIFPEEDVTDAITADTNAPYGVVLDFHYVAPLVPSMVAAPYLFSQRGWDPTTGSISILPSGYESKYGTWYEGSVYDITLNSSYTSIVITYYIKHLRIRTLFNTENGIRNYEIHTLSTEYKNETIAAPTGLYFGRNYCVAAYYNLKSNLTPETAENWWFYDMSSKIYPALIPSNSIDESNDLLPIIPIRYQNDDMTRDEVQNTELYLTSKTLLNKIGVSIDDVADLIEENPDSDEIDHAYVMFGVDLQSDEPASIRYMAEFFDFISDKSTATMYTDIEDNLLSSTSTGTKLTEGVFDYNTYRASVGIATDESNSSNSTIYGTDNVLHVTSNSSLGSFSEFGLKVEISYSYIRSEIKSGSIGDIGYATKSWSKGTVVNGLTWVYSNGKYSLDDTKLILKVQITENSYKQITVKGLVHRNYIYKQHSVITTLNDVIIDEDEHNFVIPLHYNLSALLPINIKNQLYQDSMVLVLNSVVKTHVAWYSTGFFKFVVMVVGIVISIYTGGAGSFISALATATAAGAMAVLMFLLKTIIFTLALSKALSFVAQWVGPEITAILSVAVATVAAASKIPAINSIQVLGVSMPTASTLMKLSTMLLSSSGSAFSALVEDVNKKATKFTEYAEGKFEALEEYEDLIDDSGLDAVELLDSLSYSSGLTQMANITPEEYYDLAIHTGNIGVLSLSSPMTFHNIALTLPEPEFFT